LKLQYKRANADAINSASAKAQIAVVAQNTTAAVQQWAADASYLWGTLAPFGELSVFHLCLLASNLSSLAFSIDGITPPNHTNLTNRV
jgi:hypothetical protein